MTLEQAEKKRLKAVEFLRRIGQDEEADRFESMDAAEYAEHKGAVLRDNPVRRYRSMANSKSRTQLQNELDDANSYIEELESKLDNIAGIVSGQEEDDDLDEEDDEEDDQD
jgi:hypothetical protein